MAKDDHFKTPRESLEAEHPEVLMSKNLYFLVKNTERMVTALESIACSLETLANPIVSSRSGFISSPPYYPVGPTIPDRT